MQSGDHEARRESKAAQLVATGSTGADTVQELLILSCHSSPLANRFFEDRLGNEGLLKTLLGLALEDYSGDAQMTASYWVSRFPPDMLTPHVAVLTEIASNKWDSVSVHARRALVAVAQQSRVTGLS